jgi:hypothetical protein
MPVHVLIERGTTKYASLAWIGCRVDPGQGDNDSTTSDLLLTSLVEPTAWFLLEEGQVAEFIDVENLPVVIRLNGCPLITLPTDLSTDHEALLNDLKPKIGLRDNDEVQLDHALVIDEYSAMVHSMADVFSDPTNERFGLPPALLRVPSAFSLGGNDRFWAVLGVQVGDHGVRHRVAMQLAARDLTLDDDNRLQRPAKSGIVVNRRMGTAEGELFFWQGFDVILDDCAGATEPFQHYAKSLVAPGPDDERRQRSPR